MIRKFSAVFGAVVFFMLLALPLKAQYAAIVGTVKDQQGGAMANASVTLTGVESGVSQNTSTDAEGNYEFPTVRPGNYKIRIEQKGFQNFVQAPIVLAVDARQRVDAVLQVGETNTVVTVETNATAVETESS